VALLTRLALGSLHLGSSDPGYPMARPAVSGWAPEVADADRSPFLAECRVLSFRAQSGKRAVLALAPLSHIIKRLSWNPCTVAGYRVSRRYSELLDRAWIPMGSPLLPPVPGTLAGSVGDRTAGVRAAPSMPSRPWCANRRARMQNRCLGI
jgi:hypothetical protein